MTAKGQCPSADDVEASWSSRGVTQDGFTKPDVRAPGAHIVSTLTPNSAFATLCPDLRGRRRLLPSQRHVAGRSDRLRGGGGSARCPPGLDAGNGQGRDRE